LGILATLGIMGAQCAPSAGGDPAAEKERTASVSAAITTGPGCTAAGTSTCNAQNRACLFSDGAETLCGACSAGFVANAAGACVQAQKCSPGVCPSGQLCDDTSGPTAVCLTQCDSQHVWDATLGACRAPITCAQLQCGSNMVCGVGASTTGGPGDGGAQEGGAQEGGAGSGPAQDATCRCAPGSGFDPITSSCIACANTVSCGGITGASGGVISGGDVNNDVCTCDTADNYFVPMDGSGVITPCDADGDGWVNASAEPAIDWTAAQGTDSEFYHTLAKCHVRQISSVTLKGDNGATKTIDVTAITADHGPLPLYEDASLDAPLPTAPGYAHMDHGRAVNSFTKACLDLASDFNANRAFDVDEYPTASASDPELAGIAAPGTGSLGNDTALIDDYVAYTQFSYFLEMDNGWYVPPTPVPVPAGQPQPPRPGSYVIAERHRTDGSSVGVSITNPVDQSDYWEVCPRGPDVLAASGVPGYDFYTATGTGGYSVMGHPSQFKCVHLMTADEYGTQYNEATAPQNVIVSTTGALSRTTSAGTPDPNTWSIETCVPGTTVNRPPPLISPENPSYPTVSCTAGFGGPPNMPPPTNVLRWAVVTGMNASA
jgi:hypothetical protein